MSSQFTVWELLEQVGRTLQLQYGDDPIPVSELKHQVALLGGYQESSIIPSDFCYNRTNAGIPTNVKPMFVQTRRGNYRYVGFNYSYNGPMLHKPQGQAERTVGQWRDGALTLLPDR